MAVTAADLNLHVRDNLRYLKGLDGVPYIENAIELPELATPTTPAAGRGRLFVGNTAPRNGVASCVDDAGNIFQMLQHVDSTFTPTYFGSTTAGTTTYTNQVGAYARIGPIILFQLYLNWSAATGTGNIRIGGLPVTIRSTANLFGSASIWANLITFASSGIQVLFRPNTTQLELWTPATGAGAQVPIDGAGDLAINGFYFG